MISDDFRSTGWQMTHQGAQITRYQVFGERSSGTNFVKRLIGRNTSLTPTEALGWKHGFPQMTAIPADTLIVACVRDARAWSLSMHAKPWHTPPAMQLLDYPDFIRHPWVTLADHKRYFPQVQDIGGEGLPLQHDRDPLSGLPYPDLFSLRRAKLASLLSYFQRGASVLLCRMEAVQAAPEPFLQSLTKAYDAQPNRDYRPVTKRLGSKFAAAVPQRPETPNSVPEDDLTFLKSRLDLLTESALGYDYD